MAGSTATKYLSELWIKRLARIGYASRSVVYLIIGSFAILSGLGQGGETDSKGALRVLLQQPFGKVLVGILIVGLLGYVLWRLIQAFLDTDSHGRSMKGLAIRISLLASAVTYGILAVYALSLLGLADSGGAESSTSIADRIAGIVGTKPVLLAMVLIFAGVAIAHWVKAYRRRYADHLDTAEAPMDIVHPISMLGLFARGIVFAIIALLLFYRFMTFSPSDTTPPGFNEALDFVQGLPAGSLLLIALGTGLLLFAAYSACEAIWRRINVEDADLEKQLS